MKNIEKNKKCLIQNNTGQLQLEAAICFAVFLTVMGLFLSTIGTIGEHSINSVNSLNAKAEAELCCVMADTIYTSGISEFFTEINCTSKQNNVESEISGKTKGCESIAKEIRLVQKGEKSSLEVSINEHYR